MHFVGLHPAIPHRLSHRQVIDNLHDLLFYTFLELVIVDLPDGLFKVRGYETITMKLSH